MPAGAIAQKASVIGALLNAMYGRMVRVAFPPPSPTPHLGELKTGTSPSDAPERLS